jgi:hypothetical protein
VGRRVRAAAGQAEADYVEMLRLIRSRRVQLLETLPGIAVGAFGVVRRVLTGDRALVASASRRRW